MSHKRILSIWFPDLPVERLVRRNYGAGADVPAAVVANVRNRQLVVSLSTTARKHGLRMNQPLQDALAIFPNLITYPLDEFADSTFLSSLRRVATRYSPWIAEDDNAGLLANISGCAHLFGGEKHLLEQVADDYLSLGLTTKCGIADTVGAAWALAHFSNLSINPLRKGGSIVHEARATRSRAVVDQGRNTHTIVYRPTAALESSLRIAPPSQAREAIQHLPIAALRIPDQTVFELVKLGLRTIEDIIDIPRASLAHRFGIDVIRRLDQALGIEPEPVSPVKHTPRFATRLTLPEPIGLEEDILAGLDKLIAPLSKRLKDEDRGARQIRFELRRTDHTCAVIEVGFAQPSNSVEQIRSLLVMKFSEIDPGFGIDTLRLEAVSTEPVVRTGHRGQLEALELSKSPEVDESSFRDLIGRIGTRVGLESITRAYPAESNIPEKTSTIMAAAWTEPEFNWYHPPTARPAILFPPEPIPAPDKPTPPRVFRWRDREYARVQATGPERIMPEWWIENPGWQTGTRDYWQIETDNGKRLWLYYAYGGDMAGSGWYCHGEFA